MAFNSFPFLALLLVTAGGYAVLPPSGRRWASLLASVVFYAYGSVPHLGVLGFIVVWTYLAARLASQSRLRLTFGLSVAVLILPLALFKYGAAVAGALGAPAALLRFQLLLPVGISFYTFQAVGHLVDVRRDIARRSESLVDVALFLTFFPQILAGPIERARRLLPQLQRATSPGWADVHIGCKFLLWGFFCKLVVADGAAGLVDPLLRRLDTLSGVTLWAAFGLYSFQIYFDFLGYSTIAIGAARLFGVRLARNFRTPYAATSLHDFWRRWHITLSYWFRDYLYIPLGGHRTRGLRRAGVIAVVFGVSGVWHGAGLSFIGWAAAHAAGYLAEEGMEWGGRRDRDTLRRWPLWRSARVAVTFLFATAAWVPFRLGTLHEASLVLSTMVGLRQVAPFATLDGALASQASLVPLAAVVLGVSMDSARWSRALLWLRPRHTWSLVAELIVIDTLLILVVLLGGHQTRDFIYFRF